MTHHCLFILNYPLTTEHEGDRRCEYYDGDSEYLNLTQLEALARLDPANKSVHQPSDIGQQARLGRSEQKASRKECKKKTNPNPHFVSLGRAAASRCRKCQAELDSGEKTRLAHNGGCPHVGIHMTQGEESASVQHENAQDDECANG